MARIQKITNSKNYKDITKRKDDHIKLCLDKRSQDEKNPFEKYKLQYCALPELSLEKVKTESKLFGKLLKTPLIIASMTGGSEHGRKINTNLAIAAENCGVALGVGSQRIGLEKKDASDTFKLVRKHAPNACIIANMGAVQLNYGHTISSYQSVVDMIEADALYLHLNPLQEALQPGGDSNFENLLEKITKLTRTINVPVIAKEVGHGLSGEVAQKLFGAGVSGVDVAGVGGTSYAWVEAERSKNKEFSAWFKNLGIPTDEAVSQCKEVREDPGNIIVASGGIRSPIDGLVAHGLGADFFSAAVPFLEPSMDDSPERLLETIENWAQGLRVAMFACGIPDWDSNVPFNKLNNT